MERQKIIVNVETTDVVLVNGETPVAQINIIDEPGSVYPFDSLEVITSYSTTTVRHWDRKAIGGGKRKLTPVNPSSDEYED